MSKIEIVSFNFRCRNSGKVRAHLASKSSWDDSGARRGRRTALGRRRGSLSHRFTAGDGISGLVSQN